MEIMKIFFQLMIIMSEAAITNLNHWPHDYMNFLLKTNNWDNILSREIYANFEATQILFLGNESEKSIATEPLVKCMEIVFSNILSLH